MDPKETYTPMKDPKYCFVPACKNNSRDTQKLLFAVPNSAKQEWCNAVGTSFPKRVIYICEDHLNLEEDMENYRYWITMKVRPKLKSRLPHSLVSISASTGHQEIIEPRPSMSATTSPSFIQVAMNRDTFGRNPFSTKTTRTETNKGEKLTDIDTPCISLSKGIDPGSSGHGEKHVLRHQSRKIVARETIRDCVRNICKGESQHEVWVVVKEELPEPQVLDGETQLGPPEPAWDDDWSQMTNTQQGQSRFRPQGKWAGASNIRSMAPDSKATSEPKSKPSSSGAAKREFPDDAASPSTLQGHAKRVRVQSPRMERRTYARASKDIPARLSVAICFPSPSRDLTSVEAAHIKAELERLIMDTDSSTPLPAFRRYPKIADGTVQMWCEDENALTWLVQNTPTIKLPNTDMALTVMRQTELPTRVRGALFVPKYNGDITKLQSVLIRQNTWYDIGRWSLYRATSVGGDNQGTFLTLGIPLEEVEKVLGRERRISYLLGSIYIRLYPKTRFVDTKNTDTDTEPQTSSDDDNTRLEEHKARATMTDADIVPPSSAGWTADLLGSSPSDDWCGIEERGRISDESVSS